MGKRKARQQRQQLISRLSKKQKKHLKDFGEEHPFYDRVSGKEKPTQNCELNENSEQSSSENDAESDSEHIPVYHKLLATLKTSVCSDNEEEEDESEGSSQEDTEVDSDELEDEKEMEDEDNEIKVPHPESEASLVENSQEEPGGSAAPRDLQCEAAGECTDVQLESEFSLETNFIDEECGDPSTDPKKRTPSAKVTNDPFKCHMDEELEEKEIDENVVCSKLTSQVEWPVLGQLLFSSKLEKFGMIKPSKEVDLKHLNLCKPLESTWPKVNGWFLSAQTKFKDQLFSPLQQELFCVMNSYKDLFYPGRTALKNGEEVRHVYCLHALNHVLKANAQVLGNNAKRRDQKDGADEDAFRDQGLTRPKVLIVVPFRESALRIVHILIALLESASQKKIDVCNKKRFKGEFGSDPEEKPPNLKRPEDYEAVFAGNIDDHFRIGVAVLQKSMRLYAPFYSSDIIIASPLGLRTVIGAEGENKRDYDFLSSIEILIIDEADIYLMQNWEHVLVAVRNVPLTGSISHVVVQLPHVFQKLEADSSVSVIDARFNFFIDKVLPEYRDAVMTHTLIYVPSYFDYVRLRNYFKKEELSFAHICEYSSKSGICRARHLFLGGEKQFLIITERFHFYKRYSIRGIRNLIFYELPTYPHFYSEVCNMVKLAGMEEEATLTCTAFYSKYDAQKLAAVVGVERAAQMLQSSKNVHLFVTGGTE
ncbi:digestive organ expansion factor homolog isoform X2 [Python bivittatus]|uniref:U3 small nucleolar RNA-associated protein 25 homolog n=1 Tax=Python bivittatus TaxID=176946 RepID=A0A9F2R080_PYTBI|nr:digestive organ expansion factor homolog isoform X2 [Python bivittatus]